MLADQADDEFCSWFSPEIPGLRFVYLNKELVAEPERFVDDALRWLSSPGEVAKSFMYAGSTPQIGGRRSAFVGPMGDGRVATLGRVAMASGATWIVQAKGLRTPFTERQKDGLASVGECVSELVISEQVAACGIPSCRVLALLTAPGRVVRRRQPTSARIILLRAAPEWWRCGTIEHLYYSGLHDRLREVVFSTLHALEVVGSGDVDVRCSAESPGDRDARKIAGVEGAEVEPHDKWICIDAGELHVWTDEDRDRALNAPQDATAAVSLLRCIIERTAHLAAAWQASGFVHGMLRSDNVALCGFALDLGSTSAFTHSHDLDFNPTPREPMYAFGQQPAALAAHMKQLAICLSPLVQDTSLLEDELRRFWPTFRAAQVEVLAVAEAFAAAGAISAAHGDGLTQLVKLLSTCCGSDADAAEQAKRDADASLRDFPLLVKIADRIQCV
eukprot:TRINITY_DN24039_c0_g1_i1.p1 TRINITY_DN24039_c0_g1~~TRINITY_DN24039_c0_g1_i1.p1  ORF type:complete len:446 (+),score=75.01 TRINITY_DN24039_c0_g1_i1:34-1371(+)